MRPSSHLLCLVWACRWAAGALHRDVGQKPIAESHRSATATDKAPPYRTKLLDLHKELVDIESITGNEKAIGDFLIHWFEYNGYMVKIQYLDPSTSTADLAANNSSRVAKERFNVLAVPETIDDGPEWKPRLVVTSHIDVVPPYIPYSTEGYPLDSETVIRGRGSVDAKASIAAQFVAIDSLLSSGAISPNDFIFLYVVGEETTGDGMRHFSDSLHSPDPREPRLNFDAAIFGEPTQNRLACGHKGHMVCDITARGKSGHSGYPWLGKSATEVLMRALVKILDADLGSSERFGNTTVNVGTLQGGVAANVIPASASAKIAVRVAIGSHEEVHDRIDAILREVDADALSMSCDNGYGVVETNCDVTGFETIVVNYGTDVPNFKGNHTRYLYGPGDILVAHSDHEALRVRDLEEAVEGYMKLIKHALGA